jgi:hypothetical protein
MTFDPGDFDRIQPPSFGPDSDGSPPPQRRGPIGGAPADKRQLLQKAEELNALGEHLEDIIDRIENMRSLFEREAKRIVEEDVFLKLRDDPNGALLDAAKEGRPADIALLLRRDTADLSEFGPQALTLAEENGHEECAELLREAVGQSAPWWKRILPRKRRAASSPASAATQPEANDQDGDDNDASDDNRPDN